MGTILQLGFKEIRNPSSNQLDEALERIPEYAGLEGLGVALTHDETEWQLCYFEDGRLVWMQCTYGDAQRLVMTNVPKTKVRELWTFLGAGEISLIQQEKWQVEEIENE